MCIRSSNIDSTYYLLTFTVSRWETSITSGSEAVLRCCSLRALINSSVKKNYGTALLMWWLYREGSETPLEAKTESRKWREEWNFVRMKRFRRWSTGIILENSTRKCSELQDRKRWSSNWWLECMVFTEKTLLQPVEWHCKWNTRCPNMRKGE